MTAREELFAPFRPRATRAISAGLAALTLAGATVIAVLMPRSENVTFGPGDVVGTYALALAICWFCYRQFSVAAVPDAAGITVRNLLLTRRVEWAQIVLVRFGDGRPWAQLDLADGETLAVMGVQAADGARGVAEARRLATLVALHEPRGRAGG
ncbi:PH domain-containing protein [Georgenia faecalis]|uniref:PH domain-containing protein n=1 Tax=Georgenia faecalis TaxID=2483799 RepID=A0ABV9D919_9MICO|nr:PH domain-containing protein [Georgenia faecalis]